MSDFLDFSVRTRTGTIVETKVSSVTGYSDTGKFDILPGHANFICLVEKELIYQDEQANVQKVSISKGLLRVLNNRVEVFVGLK